MKTASISALSLALTLFAAGASAQTTTDEARARAAQATAEQQRQAETRPPVAEPVATGDYRAQAHERNRLEQWQATQRAARDYAAGKRSQPLTVNSGESARAEAGRMHTEQALAERSAVLRSASVAQ